MSAWLSRRWVSRYAAPWPVARIDAGGVRAADPTAGSAAPQCGAISQASAALCAADGPGRTGVRRSQSVGLAADRPAAVAGAMIEADESSVNFA